MYSLISSFSLLRSAHLYNVIMSLFFSCSLLKLRNEACQIFLHSWKISQTGHPSCCCLLYLFNVRNMHVFFQVLSSIPLLYIQSSVFIVFSLVLECKDFLMFINRFYMYLAFYFLWSSGDILLLMITPKSSSFSESCKVSLPACQSQSALFSISRSYYMTRIE